MPPPILPYNVKLKDKKMILTYNDKKTKKEIVIKDITSIDFSCNQKEIRLNIMCEEAIYLQLKDVHIISIDLF